MHSLFLRIFMLFWVAMALIVGGSIAITFTVAAREYESPEVQRRPSVASVAIPASEVLAKGGLASLKIWLDAHKNSVPDRDFFFFCPPRQRNLLPRLSARAAARAGRCI